MQATQFKGEVDIPGLGAIEVSAIVERVSNACSYDFQGRSVTDSNPSYEVTDFSTSLPIGTEIDFQSEIKAAVIDSL